jgi:RNA-directed DNA polymerase
MGNGKSEGANSTADTGEPTQGTPSRKGAPRVTESLEGKTAERRAQVDVSTKLERVAVRARERPDEVITHFSHLIDLEWMKEAFDRTRKDGASGVDGVTATEYAANLEENLAALLERFKSGTYRAPPVRRVHIPKGDGSKTRPIGIPTFEDKVLQRAVTMLLDAVYEQEFRNCSYGFRRGRRQHQALAALRSGIKAMNGGFVIELDIQGFFDSLDHSHLRNFLDLRVRDGVIRRTIGKWLKAGVLEDGNFSRSEEGTPQGGVISPLLANIFLHHVLDKWFEDEIKPRLGGRAFIVRFADDAVMVVENENDAERIMDVLPKRFDKYGLTLHPEKTRMVRFERPTRDPRRASDDDDDEPGTFAFLGFTHHWGGTSYRKWAVKTRTEAKRIRRTLRALSEICRSMRHAPIREQHAAICKRLVGHDNYYGLEGNSQQLDVVRFWTERIWRFWLARRSQKRGMPWERFREVLARYPLPEPRTSVSALRAARAVA